MLFKILLLSVFIIFSSAVNAEDGGCNELVFNELKYLDQVVESYPFRIWYATKGKHIVNGPNVIDDLLLQLNSADKYYSEKLNLVRPLLQPRYKQAEFIDVHVVTMEKVNGIAFDEVIAEKINATSNSYSCGIKIRVNKNLDFTRNVTAAHELFHMYQYSNSMFKAGWYLEGMARWVEQAFTEHNEKEFIENSSVSCSNIHHESYRASRYWESLAERKKGQDVLIDKEYLNLKYSNGLSVFKLNKFKNASIIQNVFRNLAKESIAISSDLGFSKYNWPEKIQRSSDFNQIICNAAER